MEKERILTLVQEKKKLRVAVIQDSPVIMDKENTLVKMVSGKKGISQDYWRVTWRFDERAHKYVELKYRDEGSGR